MGLTVAAQTSFGARAILPGLLFQVSQSVTIRARQDRVRRASELVGLLRPCRNHAQGAWAWVILCPLVAAQAARVPGSSGHAGFKIVNRVAVRAVPGFRFERHQFVQCKALILVIQ